MSSVVPLFASTAGREAHAAILLVLETAEPGQRLDTVLLLADLDLPWTAQATERLAQSLVSDAVTSRPGDTGVRAPEAASTRTAMCKFWAKGSCKFGRKV